MYAVVGCSECTALWLVEGSPETTKCPRCGSRRQHAKRKKFLETEDEAAAREARARLLAERQGHGEDYADLPDAGEMAADVDDAGPSDVEYLSASGIDPDAVAEAGERAAAGRSGSRSSGGGSRKEIVLQAVAEGEGATARHVVLERATERGVDESAVRTALEKLVRTGELTKVDEGYRRL